jgi:hypothetical protein
MLRSVRQRTAVAISLLGVLLLTIGTWVLPAQHATHNCCMHMSMPCESLNASCCTVRPQIPPATVNPVVAGVTPMGIAEDFLPTGPSPRASITMIATVPPSQSPPPGIFILRI